MSDLRLRRDGLRADRTGAPLDGDDDADDDEDEGPRIPRFGGSVRFGVIAVIVVGVWFALAQRQQPDDDVVQVPSPRAVVDVPEGYAPSAVLAPDLSMAADSVGTWTLLAAEDARVGSGTWVVVACREAGGGEVRNAAGVVTATLGADLVVDSTGDDDVRVAATRDGDVATAMVLDRRPTWIATVIAGNWDGDTTDLAREVYDAAASDGCTGTTQLAAGRAGLPVRQERSLGMPVLAVGLRVASADETTVAWSGDADGESIVLTSQRPGTGGDDHDLIEFLRPTGDGEAEVLIGTTPAYRADNLDGSEALIWQRDGVIHTLSLGFAVSADVVEMAATLRDADDATWQALVDSAA